MAFALGLGSWGKDYSFWVFPDRVVECNGNYYIADFAAGPRNFPDKMTIAIEICVTRAVNETKLADYQSLDDLKYIVIVNIGHFTYGTPSSPDISVRIYDNSAPNHLSPKRFDLKNCTSIGLCSYTFSAVKLYDGHQVPAGTEDFVFDMYHLKQFVELAIAGNSR